MTVDLNFDLTSLCAVCEAPCRLVVSYVCICGIGNTQVTRLIYLRDLYSHIADTSISVFRTSHRDPNINETSSYVDLGPLYGNSQKDQDLVRNKNGRGMLHPDAFAEDRLLLLPPAVCTLLVLFNRNHNVSNFSIHVAKKN